jgi:hypothetical protein
MLVAEYDAGVYAQNSRQLTRTEDAITYNIDNDDGIVAIHGGLPPINLLLVSKQLYAEAREEIFSTTIFEVWPMTPNFPPSCLGRGYEALAESKYVKEMRKLYIRIDLVRSARPENDWLPAATFSLSTCTSRVRHYARQLCETLETAAPTLKSVEIDWIDEFGEQVEASDLELRQNVIELFASLTGVKVRMRRLVMSDEGREEVTAIMRRVLGTS